MSIDVMLYGDSRVLFIMIRRPPKTTLFPFFFNDPATTEIYPLSLHDALPISCRCLRLREDRCGYNENENENDEKDEPTTQDRKSTRLNSSHSQISYAVFCLKKKK